MENGGPGQPALYSYNSVDIVKYFDEWRRPRSDCAGRAGGSCSCIISCDIRVLFSYSSQIHFVRVHILFVQNIRKPRLFAILSYC